MKDRASEREKTVQEREDDMTEKAMAETTREWTGTRQDRAHGRPDQQSAENR